MPMKLVSDVSQSVLLTSGCVTVGLSLSALTYMMFFWLPVQYHHLLVRHRLDFFGAQQERLGETSLQAAQGTRIVTPQRLPINLDPTLDFNKTVIRTKWTRSQKGKNWKAAKIIKFPQNLPPPLESVKERNETKYLIYLCDSRMNCGGLGDRERALTSVYIWSRVIQRKFKLVMTSPCNLSNFYVPNKVDWLPKDKELETPSDNNTLFIFQNLNKVTLSKLMDGDFNENFPQKYIYLRTNSDTYNQFQSNKYNAHRLKEWSGLNDPRSRFFWSWHELMKPSDKFTSRLESILGSDFIRRKGLTPSYGNSRNVSEHLYEIGNSSLICAHVRIGKNPSNPKDEAFTAVTGEDIPVLFNFMKQKDKNGDARFFIATDYIYVRNQAQKFFGSRYIEYGGVISHIDRQRSDKDACQGFESALLDQTILSLCDVLITSRSGFSARAAHMRNSTDPVYVIDGGEVRVAEE
ncbi:hypothetical protein Btru_031987 [Bulinus truncatus]|nr:hypothetical protein Btru_031987 [Bulinus truncatus]